MENRTCPGCGKDFKPTNGNQVYCPADPSRRDKRSFCARRASNGRDPAAPPEPFDCEQCGERCIPGDNVAPHATRFCSTRCKRLWHSLMVEQAGRLLASFTSDPGMHDEVRYREAMRLDPCSYCGAPTQQLDHIEPRSKGGLDDWTNRAGTCASCNGRKQDLPLLVWMGWKLTKDSHEPWDSARRELLTRS